MINLHCQWSNFVKEFCEDEATKKFFLNKNFLNKMF